MKHLKEFFNYIKESKSIDREEIASMLLPISDMGLNISYSEGTIISGASPDDKNHGRKYLKVSINLDRLNKSDIILDGFRRKEIDDDRFWEILDEILSLRSRLLEEHISNCLIDFIIRDNYSLISLILIGDKEEENDDFLLTELMSILRARLNNMRTDFSYSTVVSLVRSGQKLSIEVKTSAFDYTDRKFNNLLRGVDMSKFSVEKRMPDSRLGDVYNIITVKN
jgi:hypothetical protein